MLHIINNTSRLQNCLPTAQYQDHILLIEDGVLEILKTDFSKIENIYFYALEADIHARGLQDTIPSHIKLIDYEGFVELTLKNFPILNWGY